MKNLTDLLITAARDDDVVRAAALLLEGAAVAAVDRNGFTSLHLAAQEGSARVAALLIDRGAVVDAIDKYGNTPLWRAVFNCEGDGTLIVLLRKAGADPHLANFSGSSPLRLARTIANYDVAQWFADLPE